MPQERHFNSGGDQGAQSDFSAPQKPENSLPTNRPTQPPTRESLIAKHNLDTSSPAVLEALDRYDALKANARISDFLGVLGEKITAPFRRTTSTANNLASQESDI